MVISPQEFKEQFFAKYPFAKQILQLFEYLPNTYFYAKDSSHRYIGVNRPVLRDVFGLADESELLGKTDLDFQPPALAEAYHAEDRKVMKLQSPLPNQVWLVPHVIGTPKWYVSSKMPLIDEAQIHSQKRVVGIAGVMYPIETPEDQSTYFQELQPVIEYFDKHFTDEISMEEMAKKVNLSSTHFNHRFRKLLRVSPTEYILSRRIQEAQRLLTSTAKSIGEVGVAVGFYDQSHFTKRFRKVTGMTPLAYRKHFR